MAGGLAGRPQCLPGGPVRCFGLVHQFGVGQRVDVSEGRAAGALRVGDR